MASVLIDDVPQVLPYSQEESKEPLPCKDCKFYGNGEIDHSFLPSVLLITTPSVHFRHCKVLILSMLQMRNPRTRTIGTHKRRRERVASTEGNVRAMKGRIEGWRFSSLFFFFFPYFYFVLSKLLTFVNCQKEWICGRHSERPSERNTSASNGI